MDHTRLRAEVADSWQRSVAAGVAVDKIEAPITLPEPDLRSLRTEHKLSRVFPLLDDVLGQAARDCDAVMAVFNESGNLLWVCGSPSTLRKAESIGFVEGSNWDERLAGTNAPGLALRLGRPVSVTRAEHFRHSVQPWSCAATPIYDPRTSSLLGVLDITGGDSIVVPQTMAMVRAAARMAEAELSRDFPAISGMRSSAAHSPTLRLEALGRSQAIAHVQRTGCEADRIVLSPRHSEILALLAATPQGLSGDELAILLYEEDSAGSTMRAELNRIRQFLGDEILGSRPYRLRGHIEADWLSLESQLAAGNTAQALRAFAGPLLPRSIAPGIVRLRESLTSAMRESLLHTRSAVLMSAWTRTSWGNDDYAMWTAQRDLAGPNSPLSPLIDGQIARLDAEYGM